MRIHANLEMLELSSTVLNQTNTIHPTLLWDEDTVVLVDTGYPGQFSLIRDAINQAGLNFEALSKIILTHQDLDHIGSLPVILENSSRKIETISNEFEKPYIEGDRQLIKLSGESIAKRVAALPPDVPQHTRDAFRATLENPPKAPVDSIVSNEQMLPYCGGILVLNTPGHTPGHISLYHPASKTLIAGDAMVVVNGQLQGPVPQFTLDMNQALQSLNTFLKYDIDTVICYHGGLFKGNVRQRIAELVAR